MAIKVIQPKHYPTFKYNEGPILVQSSKYLVLMSHRQIGGMYVMSLDFNQRDIEINVIRCYGGPSIAYGVEAWGITISLGAWNEIDKIQKMFLHR